MINVELFFLFTFEMLQCLLSLNLSIPGNLDYVRPRVLEVVGLPAHRMALEPERSGLRDEGLLVLHLFFVCDRRQLKDGYVLE